MCANVQIKPLCRQQFPMPINCNKFVHVGNQLMRRIKATDAAKRHQFTIANCPLRSASNFAKYAEVLCTFNAYK
ncbi:unnamed protein product [Ceratitis capitata]|uniref:(Mediterranean fruit fly) hypothetical protein n=1 Tax=Ceratitis capitata TaxID=7213 RepID=A0A811UA18_CERCA|nr:unnamed protein product [Ceratitis capitata]